MRFSLRNLWVGGCCVLAGVLPLSAQALDFSGDSASTVEDYERWMHRFENKVSVGRGGARDSGLASSPETLGVFLAGMDQLQAKEEELLQEGRVELHKFREISRIAKEIGTEVSFDGRCAQLSDLLAKKDVNEKVVDAAQAFVDFVSSSQALDSTEIAFKRGRANAEALLEARTDFVEKTARFIGLAHEQELIPDTYKPFADQMDALRRGVGILSRELGDWEGSVSEQKKILERMRSKSAELERVWGNYQTRKDQAWEAERKTLDTIDNFNKRYAAWIFARRRVSLSLVEDEKPIWAIGDRLLEDFGNILKTMPDMVAMEETLLDYKELSTRFMEDYRKKNRETRFGTTVVGDEGTTPALSAADTGTTSSLRGVTLDSRPPGQSWKTLDRQTGVGISGDTRGVLNGENKSAF